MKDITAEEFLEKAKTFATTFAEKYSVSDHCDEQTDCMRCLLNDPEFGCLHTFFEHLANNWGRL